MSAAVALRSPLSPVGPAFPTVPPNTVWCPVHHQLESLCRVRYEHAMGKRETLAGPDQRARKFRGELVCGASMAFVTSTAVALVKGWLPEHLRW